MWTRDVERGAHHGTRRVSDSRTDRNHDLLTENTDRRAAGLFWVAPGPAIRVRMIVSKNPKHVP